MLFLKGRNNILDYFTVKVKDFSIFILFISIIISLQSIHNLTDLFITSQNDDNL